MTASGQKQPLNFGITNGCLSVEAAVREAIQLEWVLSMAAVQRCSSQAKIKHSLIFAQWSDEMDASLF